MGDWFSDNVGWVFVAVGVAVGAAVVVLMMVSVVDDVRREHRFMAECQQDHKRYECEALWRQGAAHTTVMPMPVYIHN